MADFARPEQYLPLKIGQRDVVVVDDRQTADARRREILDHRRAYAARADHRDARFQQPRLSRAADFLLDDEARITVKLRSEEHPSELQPLMRIAYAVCRD